MGLPQTTTFNQLAPLILPSHQELVPSHIPILMKNGHTHRLDAHPSFPRTQTPKERYLFPRLIPLFAFPPLHLELAPSNIPVRMKKGQTQVVLTPVLPSLRISMRRDSSKKKAAA